MTKIHSDMKYGQVVEHIHRCSTVLITGDLEGHSISFKSFLYLSNHSVTPSALWMGGVILEESTPIKIEKHGKATRTPRCRGQTFSPVPFFWCMPRMHSPIHHSFQISVDQCLWFLHH